MHAESLTTVKRLLKYGVDMNAMNKNGQTALMRAVIAGNNEVVEYLLNQGADISVQDDSGENALILAARLGHDEIVMRLLERGANVNAQTSMVGPDETQPTKGTLILFDAYSKPVPT